MIAAVSMGMSVDSSIHYYSAFRRERRQGKSVHAALVACQQGGTAGARRQQCHPADIPVSRPREPGPPPAGPRPLTFPPSRRRPERWCSVI